MDRYIQQGDAPGLPLMAAAYVAVLVVKACATRRNLTQILGKRVICGLRMQLFGHLQSLSLSFFDHKPVGRLITRLTNDVDAFNELLTSGAVSIFGESSASSPSPSRCSP